MSGSDRARTVTLLLAALGLLLGVIALWPPAATVADGPSQRLAVELPQWVQILLLGAALVEFLAIVVIMIPNQRRKRDPAQRKRPGAARLSPLAMLALLLPYVAVAVAAYYSVQWFESHGLGWLFGGAQRGWFGGSNAETSQPVVTVPLLDFGVSATLAVLAAVVIAFSILAILLARPWVTVAAWLRSTRERHAPSLADDMASALTVGRRELTIGDDPRAAVIACYRQCEIALASRRRGRHVAETPREFLRDALDALHLPLQPIRTLLQVFERARFSDLPVTRDDRSVALHALDAIRTDLQRRREDGATA